jgi:cobalamin biosynthesis Mg chelatase CobN
MNINISKNLIAFLAVAFLVSAASASAYVPGVWDPQPRVNANEPAFTKVPTTYDAPVVPQTVAMNNYNFNTNNGSSNTNVNPNTNTSNTSTNTKTVTKNTTTNTTKVATAARVRNTNTSDSGYVSSDFNNQLKPVVTTGNNLTALSVAGSGGFMPSSVFQWFLIILLILAIIIVARMLTRSDHHEVHTVTSH